MAKHWYVRSTTGTATTVTATATTDPSTKRTGAWSGTAGDHFDSIETALLGDDTFAPVDGDIIYCSDSHALSEAVTATWTVTAGAAVSVVSVSDTNQDQQADGASETYTGAANDLVLAGIDSALNLEGIDISVGDNVSMTTIAHGMQFMVKRGSLTMGVGGGSSDIETSGDSTAVYFKDMALDWTNVADQFTSATESYIIFDGVTSAGTAVNDLILVSANSTGWADIDIKNTRLDQIIATSGNLVSGLTAIGTESIKVKLRRCKLPTSFLWNDEAIVLARWDVDIAECDQTDGYHYYYHENELGSSEEDLAQYLDATYDGTTGFSTEVITTARASRVNPYRRKLATLPARDLSGASGETYRVELVSSDAGLTDTEVWIELEYQDNTNQALGVIESTQNADSLAAGTALTSSSEVWNVTTNTEYYIEHQITQKTSVDNSNVTIYLCVAEPSTTINFDPAITVS